jgi:hypothetical protein
VRRRWIRRPPPTGVSLRATALAAIGWAAVLVAVAPASAAASAAAVSRDANGDGLADVVYLDTPTSEDGAGGATVVLGTGNRSAPTSLTGRGFHIAGTAVTSAEVIGDVNGDGLADVLVDASIAYVIYGSRDPRDVALAGFPFGASEAGISFLAAGDTTRGAGDVNGDGLADVVSASEGEGPTVATVYLGGRVKPLTAAWKVRTSGRLVHALDTDTGAVAAGDMNGDGLDDIAIALGDPDAPHFSELVFVVWGKRGAGAVTLSEGRLRSSATVRRGGRAAGRVIAPALACQCAAGKIAPVGDPNGDRLGDLGVTWLDTEHHSRSRTDVVFGSRASTRVTVTGTRASARVAASVITGDGQTPFTGAGDLDGDGRDDVLVAVGSRHSRLGLWSGAKAHGVGRASPVLSTGSAEILVATAVGDTDGDGRGDLLVGWVDLATATLHFAIVYGATDFAPLSLTSAAPNRVTTLPPGPTG